MESDYTFEISWNFDPVLSEEEKKRRAEEARIREEERKREEKERLERKFKEQNGALKVEFIKRLGALCDEFGLYPSPSDGDYLILSEELNEEEEFLAYDISDDDFCYKNDYFYDQIIKVAQLKPAKSAHEKLALEARRRKILEEAKQ